jgi:hypothetical protein
MVAMSMHAQSDERPGFSLVGGGLLFQCYRRSRLCGESLEHIRRRVAVISSIVWLPLLLLSAFEGHGWNGTIRISFLHDIEAHVRFLIALPILVAGERIVHLRIRPAVQHFIERKIVPEEEMPGFRRTLDSTLRVRNSAAIEVMLLLLVYTFGLWLWRSEIAQEGASWYAKPEGTRLNLTLAGYWYVLVSLPFFQFLVVRWYFRFLLWFSLLWRIGRLKLRLIPTHPDRAAGLGFLGASSYAFGPVLFAQGALLAGLIASQISYAGQELMSFKVQVLGFLLFLILITLSPFAVFIPHLMRAKREGAGEFGLLASRYASEFEEKWFSNDPTNAGELLGSGDIQSLADLGNSYSAVQEIRLVPFGLKDVARLAAVAAAPLLPLLLTIFSLEELVGHFLRVLF